MKMVSPQKCSKMNRSKQHQCVFDGVTVAVIVNLDLYLMQGVNGSPALDTYSSGVYDK